MGMEMSNEYVSSGSLNHAEGKSGNNVNLKRNGSARFLYDRETNNTDTIVEAGSSMIGSRPVQVAAGPCSIDFEGMIQGSGTYVLITHLHTHTAASQSELMIFYSS